jgi:hypothetical protein
MRYCLVVATWFEDGGQMGWTHTRARAFCHGTDTEAAAEFAAKTGYRHKAGDTISIIRLTDDQYWAISDLPQRNFSEEQ